VPWSGAPDSVRCTRDSNSELLTFGYSGKPLHYNSPDRPVAHRTVRCASGETTTSVPTVACNSIKCATVRAEVRHALEGAPDSLQDLSGAPPDCPVAQKTEAPTVRIQWLGDVAGAPDSVRWRTGLSGATCDSSLHQTASLLVGAINTLQPPTIHCIQVFKLPTPYKSYSIQYKTHQRDQILSQVQRSFPIK
jgi:hypothetical protein